MDTFHYETLYQVRTLFCGSSKRLDNDWWLWKANWWNEDTGDKIENGCSNTRNSRCNIWFHLLNLHNFVDDTKIGCHSAETQCRNRWHTIKKIAFLFRACQPVYADEEEMARVGCSVLLFYYIISINEENRQQHVMNYATSTFNRRRDPNGLTMKSYSSMTPASRRRPTAGSTTIIRSKSQSYRETQSDAQLIYKANFLRNVRLKCLIDC